MDPVCAERELENIHKQPAFENTWLSQLPCDVLYRIAYYSSCQTKREIFGLTTWIQQDEKDVDNWCTDIHTAYKKGHTLCKSHYDKIGDTFIMSFTEFNIAMKEKNFDYILGALETNRLMITYSVRRVMCLHQDSCSDPSCEHNKITSFIQDEDHLYMQNEDLYIMEDYDVHLPYNM